MRVAVIGAGGMGLLFARQFRDAGLEVVLSSRTKEKLKRAAVSLGVQHSESNADAVRDADAVFVSVPVDETVAVLKEIRPHVKKGALVADLTSVKKFLLPSLRRFGCDVVSVHPMFGPNTASFEGQVFILCPVKGERWLPWLKEFLEKRQGRIVIASVEEHDRMMAVVQCLTHFSYIAVASTIRRYGIDVRETRRFSSPVYELMLDMIVRIVGQDPHMYASIQMRNPYAKRILRLFLGEAAALERSVESRDEKKFVGIMASAAKCLGDMESAMYKSNKVLATLREEFRQLKGMAGKKVALRHEQSGELHAGVLESISGSSVTLIEDGKRTSLKVANVRLLSPAEARQARKQRYGVTRRDLSYLFPRGFSGLVLPEVVSCFFEDVAESRVVDVYESDSFGGRKSITLRAEILNDSNVKGVEERIMKLMVDLGGERR